MQREAKNYQFDFLRPQHSLFQYFTRMVEQYTKVLYPSKELLSKLDSDIQTPKDVIRQARYRVEWTKLIAKEKQREEEEKERERVSYLQIDWHDFVIVETVDFQPGDTGNFPPPTTPEQVGARVLLAERRARGENVPQEGLIGRTLQPGAITFGLMGQSFGDEELLIEKMQRELEETPEVEMEEADNAPPEVPPPAYVESASTESQIVPPSSAPSTATTTSAEKSDKPSEGIIIRKDYNPKAKTAKPNLPATATGLELVSPLTGETIQPGKVGDNIKYNLLDPKWIQDKERQIKEIKEREEVYAIGTNITSNLKHIAERRSDIFGNEETSIGSKASDQVVGPSKDQKVSWDGHSSSKSVVTAAAAKLSTDIDQTSKSVVEDRIGPKPTISAPASTAAFSSTVPLQVLSAPRATAPNVVLMQQPLLQQTQLLMGNQASGMFLVQQPASVLIPQQAGVQLRQPTFPITQQLLPTEEEDVPSKKAKAEDSLIPEQEWLATHDVQATFFVQCPSQADKPDWKLQGQALQINLPLTDTISVVKAKVQELTGVPPAKQKLQVDGMFTKDAQSLAFYNIGPGSMLVLQMKERGGRKK